ncbi:hypothetical protein KJ891_01285, partial [Candidatus Micrarchaeota archaeon]|nr:hypothetical protein [Candidatus Micrarchaeota archaeon]
MAVPSNIITIQAELNPVQAQAAIVESAESKGLGTVNPPPAVADAPSVTDAPPAGAVPGTVHGVPPVQSVPVLREAVSPPAVQGGTGHITEFNVKPAPVVRQDIVADSVKAAVADVEKRAPVKASVPAPQATEAARVNNPVSGGQPVVEAAQKPVTLRGEGWTEVEIPAVESRAVPDAEPRDIVANGRLNEPVPLVVALEENP